MILFISFVPTLEMTFWRVSDNKVDFVVGSFVSSFKCLYGLSFVINHHHAENPKLVGIM